MSEHDRRVLAATRPFARSNNAVAIFQVTTTMGGLFAIFFASTQLTFPTTLAFIPLLVALLIRTFVLQHDVGHHSLFSSSWMNDATGLFISFITGIPYEAWRTEHGWHHSHQSKLSHRGVDRMNSPMTTEEARANPSNAQLRSDKISPWTIFTLGTASLVFIRKLPSGFFQFRPNFRWPFFGRHKMVRGVWITNIGHIAYHVVMVQILDVWSWALVLLPSMLMGAAIGSYLFWVQHNFERTWHSADGEWNFTRVALNGSSYLRLNPIFA